MVGQLAGCPFQLHPIKPHPVSQALCHLGAVQAALVGYLTPAGIAGIDKELRDHAQDERGQL